MKPDVCRRSCLSKRKTAAHLHQEDQHLQAIQLTEIQSQQTREPPIVQDQQTSKLATRPELKVQIMLPATHEFNLYRKNIRERSISIWIQIQKCPQQTA